MTSISSIGQPVAGYNFTLICSVTLIDGLTGMPTVTWIDSSDQQITSAGDLTVNNPMIAGLQTNRTLYFDPIRTRDMGTYTCVATLPSPALSTPLNTSALYTINVQLSKKIIMHIHG